MDNFLDGSSYKICLFEPAMGVSEYGVPKQSVFLLLVTGGNPPVLRNKSFSQLETKPRDYFLNISILVLRFIDLL